MTIAARSFGNAAEYIPAGMVAMTLVAMTGGSTTEVHIIGGLLFVVVVLKALRPGNLDPDADTDAHSDPVARSAQ